MFFYIRIFFLTGCLFSFFAQGQLCEEAFIKGSRLYYEVKQSQIREESARILPTNTDPKVDRHRQNHDWNVEPIAPELLKSLLPKDVHFIKYQQFEPSAPTVIKFDEPGSALIVRAHYNDGGKPYSTNVVFSSRALKDNMNSGKNWLVGENARAAILFLHGGGTRTTGAHVARPTVTHFENFKVDVVAIDLPWHNQGHREYLSFESEIRLLANFAKKFIPPHVPLFVWGHSYGSVFAEQLRMMTDRPHSEFLFHNNLKGVVIMSTAVDTAPGRPASEKLEILERTMDDVQQNRLHEGAPTEQQVLQNLVEDGKVSPLGGFAAMANIVQFDQTLPAHSGKHWVPGVMVVGKYDSLVYLGNEVQYEIYKEHKNMQAHYLDRLTYVHNKDRSLSKVGHLLRDMLDPKSRTPIDLLITKNFIEEQLQVRAVKQAILSELRRSGLDPFKEEEIIKELKYLHFFKDIETFFAEQHLDLVILTTIQKIIKAGKNRPILVKVNKNQDRISNYIQVVQQFANDLAFRDFLTDYRLYEDKKTIGVKNLIKERDDNIREIGKIINSYSTPQRRTFHVLNQLSSYRPADDIGTKSLLEEIKAQMVVIMAPEFLRRLNNNHLKKDILQLNKLLSSTEGIEKIKARAQEIKEQYRNMWPVQNTQSNHPAVPNIVMELFFPDSITKEQVVSALKLENLPERVMGQLSVFIEKHFKIKNILDQTYIPKIEDLKQVGIDPGPVPRVKNIVKNEEQWAKRKEHREYRVQNAVDALQEHVQRIREFSRLLIASVSKEKELKSKYKNVFGEVVKRIKTIRKALEKASVDPPYSLRTEYQNSQGHLENLKQLFREMDKRLNIISANVFEQPDKLIKESDIDNNLKNQSEFVDHFSNFFSQYIHNRSLLRKRVISAIEKGEMGEDIQKAVIDIYGVGSNGERPVVGTKSLYLELEKLILELAKMEAEKIKNRTLLIEAKMEYNVTLASILQMLKQKPESGERGKQVLDDLQRASNIINIIDISMADVLSKSFVSDSSTTPIQGLRGPARDRMLHYITSEEQIFSKAIQQWKSMNSGLAPMLPTE